MKWILPTLVFGALALIWIIAQAALAYGPISRASRLPLQDPPAPTAKPDSRCSVASGVCLSPARAQQNQ